jgi:hypothetical protein
MLVGLDHGLGETLHLHRCYVCVRLRGALRSKSGKVNNPDTHLLVLRPDNRPYPSSICALRHGQSGVQFCDVWRQIIHPHHGRVPLEKECIVFVPTSANVELSRTSLSCVVVELVRPQFERMASAVMARFVSVCQFSTTEANPAA